MFKRKDSPNWYYYKDGKKVNSGTPDKALAKQREAKALRDAYEQKHLGAVKKRSWLQAVEQWQKDTKDLPQYYSDDLKFKWLKPFLDDETDINRISRQRVHEIMESRGVSNARKPANSTANRFVALIGAVLNAAEGDWEWNTKAPKLRRYPEPVNAGRALTIEEWKKLEKELPGHLRLAATFAVCTGLREAKVFGLRWEQLGTNQSLYFDGTANKRGNCIPLNATSLAIITTCRSLPVRNLTHVFSYAGRKMRRHGQESFILAGERAGIGHVKWKDLRTTFCSWLAQNGVDEPITRRLMGHVAADKSDAKQTAQSVHDRYKILYVEHLRPFTAIIDKVLTEGSEEARLVSHSMRQTG